MLTLHLAGGGRVLLYPEGGPRARNVHRAQPARRRHRRRRQRARGGRRDVRALRGHAARRTRGSCGRPSPSTARRSPGSRTPPATSSPCFRRTHPEEPEGGQRGATVNLPLSVYPLRQPHLRPASRPPSGQRPARVWRSPSAASAPSCAATSRPCSPPCGRRSPRPALPARPSWSRRSPRRAGRRDRRGHPGRRRGRRSSRPGPRLRPDSLGAHPRTRPVMRWTPASGPRSSGPWSVGPLTDMRPRPARLDSRCLYRPGRAGSSRRGRVIVRAPESERW